MKELTWPVSRLHLKTQVELFLPTATEFYFIFIQVVWDLLTADSNNNNGWIGGTDVDTEVRHPARWLWPYYILHIPCSGDVDLVRLNTVLLHKLVERWLNYSLDTQSRLCVNAFLVQPAGGPVQNCMQMRWADGLWDDVSCSGSKEFFVCKKWKI